MSSNVAALTQLDGSVGERLDGGALLDRAAAFVRSWGSSDVPRTSAHALELWRLAERDLDAATPGSDAWLGARERFVAARSEYHRLFDLAAIDADGLSRVG